MWIYNNIILSHTNGCFTALFEQIKQIQTLFRHGCVQRCISGMGGSYISCVMVLEVAMHVWRWGSMYLSLRDTPVVQTVNAPTLPNPLLHASRGFGLLIILPWAPAAEPPSPICVWPSAHHEVQEALWSPAWECQHSQINSAVQTTDISFGVIIKTLLVNIFPLQLFCQIVYWYCVWATRHMGVEHYYSPEGAIVEGTEGIAQHAWLQRWIERFCLIYVGHAPFIALWILFNWNGTSTQLKPVQLQVLSVLHVHLHGWSRMFKAKFLACFPMPWILTSLKKAMQARGGDSM